MNSLRRETIGLVVGPALFLAVLAAPIEGMPAGVQRTLAVTTLMAAWWVTEAIPLAATSLLPLALFPVLGLGTAQESAAPYANHIVYLFLGGFMLAQAMQRWNLHKRMALSIVSVIGTSPSMIVLGFMCAAGFVSMWVSNTATAAMMMPIGLAVIDQAVSAVQLGQERGEIDAGLDVAPGRFHFGTCLMVGIAYGASIGGVSTLIGTPPNGVLVGAMAATQGIEISFLSWLGLGLPLSVLFIPLVWLWLTRMAFPIEITAIPGGRAHIRSELAALGRLSTPEMRLSAVFVLTALAWMFRPLWTRAFETGGNVLDSTIAMIATIVLFLVPAGGGERLLNWEWAKKLPWDVLILFGGGFSLAAAFERNGLSTWVGDQLQFFAEAPLPVFILVIVLVLVSLTEFASNVASTAMAVPILAATANQLGLSPLVLCIPATLAASCAFMLPAATPPNAIVFGSGYLTVPQMVRAGVGANLIGVALITLFTILLVGPLFGV